MEEFCDDCLRVVVSQVCLQAGFDGGAEEGAIDTLASLMRHFVEEVGREAAEIAHDRGCSSVSYFALIDALTELGCPPSELHKFAKTDSVSDLLHTVLEGTEVPVPCDPVILGASALRRHRSDADERPEHIPKSLPSLPDPHTYANTQVTAKAKTRRKRLRARQETRRQLSALAAKARVTLQTSEHAPTHDEDEAESDEDDALFNVGKSRKKQATEQAGVRASTAESAATNSNSDCMQDDAPTVAEEASSAPQIDIFG
ncbi:MAG: hypothetical protein MHM6MM_002064 [Cercozoa sp. M6MM]